MPFVDRQDGEGQADRFALGEVVEHFLNQALRQGISRIDRDFFTKRQGGPFLGVEEIGAFPNANVLEAFVRLPHSFELLPVSSHGIGTVMDFRHPQTNQLQKLGRSAPVAMGKVFLAQNSIADTAMIGSVHRELLS